MEKLFLQFQEGCDPLDSVSKPDKREWPILPFLVTFIVLMMIVAPVFEEEIDYLLSLSSF